MRVICVDDEQPALDNFKLTCAPFADIDSLCLFLDGSSALEWCRSNPVDVAFLDMEMPGIHGLNLAVRLNELQKNIRIVFVTAYGQFALDAFGVDAIGYVLKPYSRSDIRRELDKAARFQPKTNHRVSIQTMPTFSVSVQGKPLHMAREKAVELFALLVDRGERGITSGEGIACLWPERASDANTQALLRMTYKRLADALEEAGIGDILCTEGNRRFLRVDQVDCDLYRILAGDASAAKRYAGQYLSEYAWAEERNGQLYRLFMLEEPDAERQA